METSSLDIEDVDGDGIEDVLLGDEGGTDPFGTPTGLVTAYSVGSGTQLWSAYGKVPGERFGSSIAGLGDITGDGIPEVAVGAANGGAARVLSCVLLPNALASPVGAGCSPTGLSPLLTSSAPRIGETWTAFVSNARPNSPTMLFYSAIPALPTALPNGCTWFLQTTGIGQVAKSFTSPLGTWAFNSSLPYVPSLIGRQIAMQAVVLGAPRYQLTIGIHHLVGL